MSISVRAETETEAADRVGSSAVLACGHPGLPENMIEGKCGTCQLAAEFENLSKHDNRKFAECCIKIAKMFRSGDILYDRRAGKSLIEWEIFLKPVNPKANIALYNGMGANQQTTKAKKP